MKKEYKLMKISLNDHEFLYNLKIEYNENVKHCKKSRIIFENIKKITFNDEEFNKLSKELQELIHEQEVCMNCMLVNQECYIEALLRSIKLAEKIMKGEE